MLSDLVTVWFFVNPQSGNVDRVFSFFPLGISVRENGEWKFTRRVNSGIDSEPLSKDDIYQLDWSTDETVVDDTFLDADFDPDHIAVKMYDSGELTLDELNKYAKKIIDSKDIQDIPSEG